MRFWALLFLLCFCTFSYPQDLEIIHVNPLNFPIVEAIVHSGDDFGTSTVAYNRDDFTITEANQQNEILQVKNPNVKELPLSILLVFDVSGSMKGERIRILQNAAINFISRVPLQYSEVAIASFNETVMVNCDFTHNRSKLLHTMNNLQVFGGTSYNEAYLNYELGAMEFVNYGEHKKVIVFLTDGMSSVDYEKVIQEAQSRDISIYNVTVALPMPETLKHISMQTGGAYYESAQSEGELGNIFLQMLGEIQSDLYGKVYWKAPYGCIAERSGTIEYLGKAYSYSYTIPASKVSKLISGPGELFYGDVEPGSQKGLQITFMAKNNPVDLKHLQINSTAFKLRNPFEAFTLLPQQEEKLTIKYLPGEEGQQIAYLKVQVENCPDLSVKLTGGIQENIRIIRPGGKEKFIVGLDTVIAWEGIKAGREVDISYRTVDSLPWKPVGIGKNHNYFWTIPDATSDEVQVRLAPRPEIGPNMLFVKEIGNFGAQPVYMGFNKLGNNIMLSNNRGEVIVVDRKSNNLRLHARGLGNKGFCFTESDSILSFGKDQITLHSGAFGSTSATLYTNRKVFSAHCRPNGREFLLPGIVRRLKDGNTIVHSAYFGTEDTVFTDKLIRHATITRGGDRAVTVDIDRDLKIWDLKRNIAIYEKALDNLDNKYIISPNQKTLLVKKTDREIDMMDLADANLLFSMGDYTYMQFAKSGNFFLCTDEDSLMYFIDSYSGKVLKKLPFNSSAQSLGIGYVVLYVQNDSLVREDLNKQVPVQSYYSPGITGFLLCRDDSKVLVMSTTGVHSLLSVENLNLISELRTEPNQDLSCSFSQSGQEILVRVGKNKIELWSPEVEVFEPAISENFSIVKPRIEALDTVDLGAYFINKQENIQVDDIYSNLTGFTTEIKDVELTATDFQLVGHPKKYFLAPGESKGVELGFSPTNEGVHFGQLTAYTPFDTLQTVVYARAVSASVELLNNPVNLGAVLLNASKDTTLPVLANTGTSSILLEQIGPDGTEGSLVTIVSEPIKRQYIVPGDTLAITLRFKGLEGGRTSNRMLIHLDGPDSLKVLHLFGEVLVPRKISVSVQTFNVADSLPIEAEVECTDLETGYRLKQVNEPYEGQKAFNLYPGRIVGLFASKQGYLSSSSKIDLTKSVSNDTIVIRLYLTELKPGAIMRLNCIFFDFNSSKLKAGSYPELHKIIELLNDNNEISVEIQGHTDDVGSKEFNLKLSKRRAQAIKEYLVSEGMDQSRLFVKAFGYSKPIASNEDEEGRAQNRRVEVVVR